MPSTYHLSHVWPAPCSSQETRNFTGYYTSLERSFRNWKNWRLVLDCFWKKSCSGSMWHSAAIFRPFTTGEFHSGYLHHHYVLKDHVSNNLQQTSYLHPNRILQILAPLSGILGYPHCLWIEIATKISNQKPPDLLIQSFRCAQSCGTSSSPPFCVAHLGGWQDDQDQEQWLQPFLPQTCFI